MPQYKARKPHISVNGMGQTLAWYIKPIKETVDMLTGASGGELTGLSPEASKEEIVGKINEIIARLNVSGEVKNGEGKNK